MELNPETVCGLILQVRQFDGKEGAVDPETASNPSDTDGDDAPYKDTLQTTGRDSIETVLRAEVGAMNEEEQAELVALTWVGRGDYDAEAFDEAKARARESRDAPTADYLLGQPMLGDLLAEGMAAIGQPCRF